MFEGLKKAFQKASSSIKEKIEYKEIKEDYISDVMEEMKIDLIENDVAYDVADKIIEIVKSKLVGSKVRRGKEVEEVIKGTFYDTIYSIINVNELKFIESIKDKCKKGEPFVIVFLGINGVGKTTTIAKIANLLKKNNISTVIAASDTFRAGAQEQIDVHAKKIDVPIIKGQYGADPASIAFDAINFARSRKICAVLIDTAGRMHSDVDLMRELKKIIRISKPDLKIMIVDALTGNDAVEQARTFNEIIGIDGIIVTKIDADVKGGVALSVASITNKPILYLGYGQNYDDIKQFDAKEYVKSILS
ncbi:MAG: signal recognition particle-docking protein FtsY [Caldisphaera sp.]|nr:MAG: signal recognition particle-docking protein FtsY [Caldisphaera sp.]PMP92009.1 MAG: signal recognition particle-docking protein FtsY [Caldisphaera sp.]